MAVAGHQSYPWYAVVAGKELEQGDLLAGCPVFEIPPDAVRTDAVDFPISRRRQNVVVLTQSCDLAMRSDGRCNVDEAILCPVFFRHELQEHRVYGKASGWEEARKGRHPGYHLLNRCDLDGHEFDFALVDLRRVYSLSVEALRTYADSCGERVRLLPPYREHLSQAFARFFMRVGLPIDIPPFR